MAKLESTFKNMVLSLMLISMAMACALGFVYTVTKGPIEEANRKKEIQAIRDVLPPFDNDPTTAKTSVDGLDYYTATREGQPIGYAVKTYTDKGFSGHFTLMVGFKPDGTIKNVAVLDQKETPGLGNKMKEPRFKDQFMNKNPANFKLQVKKDGGQVDAITAATISSRAFCDAVQRAYDGFETNLKSGKIQATADSLKTDTTAIKEGGQQ